MATPLSHLAVPLALTAALGADAVPPGLLARVCAVLPDLDALGLWLGFRYVHPFGRRGIAHSLPVAVALAGAGTLSALSTRRGFEALRSEMRWVWGPCLAVALGGGMTGVPDIRGCRTAWLRNARRCKDVLICPGTPRAVDGGSRPTMWAIHKF